MRGYLLDTHVLLWWLSDPTRLSKAAQSAIADGSHAVFGSAAGVWEMAIKRRLGRLDYPSDVEAVLARANIEVMSINARHALVAAELPMHHQDPFDRMHIAQARVEELVLVTRDSEIARYDVALLPA